MGLWLWPYVHPPELLSYIAMSSVRGIAKNSKSRQFQAWHFGSKLPYYKYTTGICRTNSGREDPSWRENNVKLIRTVNTERQRAIVSTPWEGIEPSLFRHDTGSFVRRLTNACLVYTTMSTSLHGDAYIYVRNCGRLDIMLWSMESDMRVLMCVCSAVYFGPQTHNCHSMCVCACVRACVRACVCACVAYVN